MADKSPPRNPPPKHKLYDEFTDIDDDEDLNGKSPPLKKNKFVVVDDDSDYEPNRNSQGEEKGKRKSAKKIPPSKTKGGERKGSDKSMKRKSPATKKIPLLQSEGNKPKPEKPRATSKSIQSLVASLKLVPFVPDSSVDVVSDNNINILKKFNLYKFSKIVLETDIRIDLVSQLILNYDSVNRCSYVNDNRIIVSRIALAKSLDLRIIMPTRNEDDYPTLDCDDVCFLEFIYSFVSTRMILHGESFVWKTKVYELVDCIIDGHPKYFDAASLMWSMMERELMLGEKLVHCYYASHMQRLIRSQIGDGVFKETKIDDEKETVDVEAEKEPKIIHIKDDEGMEGSKQLTSRQLVEKVDIMQKTIDSQTAELEQLKLELLLVKKDFSDYKKRNPPAAADLDGQD